MSTAQQSHGMGIAGERLLMMCRTFLLLTLATVAEESRARLGLVKTESETDRSGAAETRVFGTAAAGW